MILRSTHPLLLLLLAAGAHATPPTTLRLERTLGDAFEEEVDYQTILPLDHNRVATLVYEGDAKVWDVETGKILAWIRPGENDFFIDLLPLPDSDRLVLAKLSEGLLLWRPGQPPETLLSGKDMFLRPAWHPAGFIAAPRDDGQVIFTDPTFPARGGRMVLDHSLASIAFSPDGKRLIGVRKEIGTLGAWSVPTLPAKDTVEIKPTPPLEILPAARSPILRMSPSPDGRQIVLVERNNLLSLIDSAPGLRERWRVEIAGMDLGHAAWAPDGSWIALTAADGNIYRVDPGDGTRKLFAPLPGEGNEAVAISRDGKFLFTGADHGRLCIFDTATGRLLNPGTGRIHDSQADMRPRVAVLTRNDSAIWIEQADGILEIPLDGSPSRLVMKKEETLLIGRAGTNIVLAVDGRCGLLNDDGNHRSFEDSKSLVIQVATEHLKPLNAKPGPALGAWLLQNNDRLGCFAFSPEGPNAVFFDLQDKTLTLWDLARDRRVSLPLPKEFHPGQMVFSPVDPNTFCLVDGERLLVFVLVPAPAEGVITPREFDASVKRLSSDRYREREEGMRRLRAGGSATLTLLKTAATPNDPEVAERLGDVREYLESAGAPSVSMRTADLSQLDYRITQTIPTSGGRLVAIRAGGVMLFSLRDGAIEMLNYLETSSQPVSLALSRDGRRAVTLNANGTVSLFRLE